MRSCSLFFIVFLSSIAAISQRNFQWAKDGKSYYVVEGNELVSYQLPGMDRKVMLDKSMLTLPQDNSPMEIVNFSFSPDQQKVFVFTHAKKVWRYETKGDYYVLNLDTKLARKLGKSLPASSLMFAKFSPDSKKVAYVSGYNIYVEDIATGTISPLTTGGSRKLINGTFDWAYEEEFFCRDGFRWSPDSKQIAYWQIRTRATPEYLMLNMTDSIYPVAIPVEYPVAGQAPSSFKIGVVSIAGKTTRWMNIPYDQKLGNYAPRMEWAPNSQEVIVQYLDRKQQVSRLLLCSAATGVANTVYTEKDNAWIDILPSWDQDYAYGGWDWINQGKEFIWATEKDGWRHLYRVSKDGKQETLVTKGNFDVMDISGIDEKGGYVYYLASPDNATQSYLYRSRLDGQGAPERVSPASQTGSHEYDISPGALYAQHSFSNYYTPGVREIIALGQHQPLKGSPSVADAVAKSDASTSPVHFFTVTTAGGVTMDGWMALPPDFDSTKKYPVLFYVYTEPWGQTAKDTYGTGKNFLYQGDLGKDGYIYVSVDNRGTPVPKGRAWRKSVYRNIGRINIEDQAMAAREILKRPYMDTARVAVWGWSGGGSATLNLMFQYPDIYKTGISIAAVGNQLTYDNIYQERYMGLPQENLEDFIKGSPISHVKNLKGKLLYIHGTGDDNVHYNNAEMLINELIKHNKQFQLMSYPNRTHSISEGPGTIDHLIGLYTQFLRQNCSPGAR
ncbi:S9 family peptidase [Flavihumibacter fluvii]|uniref:S9 family peptidase n=1 Tax=Flavihumibacter fluvii TaxID=2838157 RepID=UPI001BDE6315|nr:S9 family peptidase [Flavihumibacter fluvii]ULQ54527.1 S9 family peptidase [Flavihumibacter fluvii]